MSTEYHKIQTLFERDAESNYKHVIPNRYAKPEFEYLRECRWEFTEKVDGMNIRVFWDGWKITFGGKTDNAQIPAHLINALNDLFLGKEAFFHDISDIGGVCLYGEGYGAKIQKGGGNYRQDQGFVLFDVRIGDWWLSRSDAADIAGKLGLDVVPVIDIGDLSNMVERVRTGFDSAWGPFPAEGIVARPTVELCDRAGRRIITKLKCKDFPE